MINIYLHQGFHTIVAACAFCGRWRDALGEYHTPPSVVDIMVEIDIIELSHTYCASCLRQHAEELGGRIAREIADKEEATKQMRPHAPDDFVHNLIQAGRSVANAQGVG